MDNWIAVSERPLFTILNEKGRWQATEDGDKPFMAAVPYYSKRKPGEKLWWIRHCVLEESGLSVVTDDGTEPSGWGKEAVEFWQPLPPDPDTTSTQKERLSADVANNSSKLYIDTARPALMQYARKEISIGRNVWTN